MCDVSSRLLWCQFRFALCQFSTTTLQYGVQMRAYNENKKWETERSSQQMHTNTLKHPLCSINKRTLLKWNYSINFGTQQATNPKIQISMVNLVLMFTASMKFLFCVSSQKKATKRNILRKRVIVQICALRESNASVCETMDKEAINFGAESVCLFTPRLTCSKNSNTRPPPFLLLWLNAKRHQNLKPPTHQLWEDTTFTYSRCFF